MRELKNIVLPLKKSKYATIAVISMVLLGLGYILSAAIIGILSTPGLSGTLLEKLEFGISKSFSTFTFLDYLFVIMFPILGGLLISHFVYQKELSKSKVPKNKSGVVGIVGIGGGVAATACSACIIPVFGLIAIAGILSPILSFAKIAALALLLYGLYSVSKQTCIACKI